MKKFLLSLLFVVVGLFAADRLGGMVMWWVNQHTHDVSGPKMAYLTQTVGEEVVLMGASRCNMHYVPSTISDSLGMAVYNGGISETKNIYSHYIMLCHMLERHTPRVICLDLTAADYLPEEEPYDRISFFAPYYGRNEAADSVFRLSGKAWLYSLSHLCRYNAKAPSHIAGLFYDMHEKGDNGFIPLERTTTRRPEYAVLPTERHIDVMKMGYLQRFITQCHRRGIKLVFVVSPMFAKVDKHYYGPLKWLARRNGVPFLDYHSAGLFADHPEYFRDYRHLLEPGARQFSQIFAHDLKRMLMSYE